MFQIKGTAMHKGYIYRYTYLESRQQRRYKYIYLYMTESITWQNVYMPEPQIQNFKAL